MTPKELHDALLWLFQNRKENHLLVILGSITEHLDDAGLEFASAIAGLQEIHWHNVIDGARGHLEELRKKRQERSDS